jgi:hypothetical protein
MEQHVFAFSSIIEGTTEKALQLKMPPKSIYNRNFGFIYCEIKQQRRLFASADFYCEILSDRYIHKNGVL